MNRFSIVSKAAIAATALTFSVLAPAATTSVINTRVDNALTRFYAQGANHRDLAKKASAVLVFPRVTKAGAGVGGEYGEGALEVNGAGASNEQVENVHQHGDKSLTVAARARGQNRTADTRIFSPRRSVQLGLAEVW